VVAAIGATVWFSAEIQGNANERTAERAGANDDVTHKLLSQERTLNAYLASGKESYLDEYEAAGRKFEQAAALAAKATESVPAEQNRLELEINAARHWQQLAERTLASGGSGRPQPSFLAEEREGAVEVLLARAEDLDGVIDTEGRDTQSKSVLIALVSIGLLGILILSLGVNAKRDDRRRRRARRFAEGLQSARSEIEAYGLIKAHVERAVRGADVSVFNRNNSADRLEPSTAIAEESPLDVALRGAKPDDCRAVRTAKPAPGGTRNDDVVRCDICGKLKGGSLCVPSIVGGEVIGSVLVRAGRPLGDLATRETVEAVSEASPLIAHLRSLAIAERRAASDALTGLPNKRAAEDTLKRLVAQAGRDLSPLTAIVFDLDHFKRINDSLGHPKGDEVLAAVGSATRSAIRESDFAARYGGEEFLVLLPACDREAGEKVAEKLMTSIRAIRVPEVEGVTASFGVCSMPEDADSQDELLRRADRALYIAKRAGRDRVETAEAQTASSAAPTGNGRPAPAAPAPSG
jgi:diguanylate cyclase (GGDEF)-like protein